MAAVKFNQKKNTNTHHIPKHLRMFGKRRFQRGKITELHDETEGKKSK
jgi:hypothetical protein